MKITAIILTFNEEIHLARCIESLLPLTKDIVVVDSLSTDRTIEIARKYSARVLERAWENNHSIQFNWALTQLNSSQTEWVLRIDADEVMAPGLVAQLQQELPKLDNQTVGIHFFRKMRFQGKLIEHGGVGRNKVSRLFRYGRGKSEARWMDEHIKIDGRCIDLAGYIIDDNLNSVSWWIAKHNNYASREAVDLLNLKYQFATLDSVSNAAAKSAISKKRWIKEHLYAKLPLGMRSLSYFLYRYLLLAGFLDGSVGTQFHFLQAFWYRYLVDIKFAEVERYMRVHAVPPKTAIDHVLGIKLNQ
jgi:glycosyltransferase involved in cell wall biosynthesis